LQGKIRLKKPAGCSKAKGGYYEVTVLIDMEVVDRNLKFTVRLPAENGGVSQTISRDSFSIVAAFEPGTA
jgi:hypothetical protein